MISAILLAAGQSTRMNGENKLTKKIHGMSLINHSLKNTFDSEVNEIIVVLGFEQDIIKKIINKNAKIKFAINKNFKDGISSSIKTGLNYLSKNTEAFFICLADMPMINKNLYNELIKLKNKKEIIVPTYKSKQRNPVLFSISMKQEIMKIEGDFGAKKIIENNIDKVLCKEILFEKITKDFNRKEDFNF